MNNGKENLLKTFILNFVQIKILMVNICTNKNTNGE